MELINGAMYRGERGDFVLIYFGSNNRWGMLHLHRHIEDGLSSPMFQHDHQGIFMFTTRVLKEYWKSDNWIMLDGRLRIEKIDPEMSLVDYPIGGELVEVAK